MVTILLFDAKNSLMRVLSALHFYMYSTRRKSPWCRERLKAVGEGDNRGRDGWMASPTQSTSLSKLWELVMDRESLACHSPQGCRVRHDWATELNQTSSKGVQNPYIVLWFSQTYFKFESECINCLWNWPDFCLWLIPPCNCRANSKSQMWEYPTGNSIGSPVNIYQSMEWILL